MTELTEAAPAPTEAEVLPSEPVVQEQPQEQTEDDSLSEIYDRLTGDAESKSEEPKDDVEPVEADAEPVEDEPEPEPEPEQEDVELPHDLPVKLKDGWKDVPEQMRDAITSAHRDMALKVSNASREVNALKPIRGALEDAIKANPAISNMKPEEVAAQLPGLVAAGQAIKSNPVQAILSLAQQHGVAQHLAQALGGNVDAAQFQQEIANLRQENEQLRQGMNPDAMKEQFNSWQAESATMSAIQRFASEAEHWSELEDSMPAFVSAAQQILPEGTAPEAVLKEAYTMAVERLLPDKAKAKEPAPEADPAPDPAKVESAKQATSVNVQAKSAGKPKPMTEDEILEAVWRKNQS